MHRSLKPASAHIPALVRLLLLMVGLSAGQTRADEYSEISQMLRAGRQAEALTRVERHLATKPRDPQMRYFKGIIQRDTGQQTEALATFTKLTEDYPELPEPYNGLAVIHAAQGDYEKARLALEMAIRANPAYATAYENLGDVQIQLASQTYCKALQLEASNSKLQSKLSNLRLTCP
jgi:tetratricopeptide (TPR) repeat protein